MAKNFCYGQDMFVKKKNIDPNLVTFPNYLNSLMIILFSTDFKTLKSLYYTYYYAYYATLHPAMSVGWLVGWLVGQLLPYLIFWPFFAFSAYCSCLSAQVTLSITAPAHPHMIGVTINPDFSFFFNTFFP